MSKNSPVVVTPVVNTASTESAIESKEQLVARLLAEVEALKAQNEALTKAKVAGLSYKVSEKGALSVYGMGRFPVTLYRSQWETLFANREGIEAFLKSNAHLLSTKEDREERENERKANERLDRAAKFQTTTDAKGRTVITPKVG